MKSNRFALIMLIAISMTVSSIGALNYLFSEQNRPNSGDSQDFKTIHDHISGVGLFQKGIYVIATSYDPLTLKSDYLSENDYWQKLKENTITSASSDEFISLIVSRGDLPTGGYTIQVESFSWLESCPVKLRFHVNFTDPGGDVTVTQALTNPLVLTPIGKLYPGEYLVEVHVTPYMMSFDEQRNRIYTPVLTFKEEVWKQTFIIQSVSLA